MTVRIKDAAEYKYEYEFIVYSGQCVNQAWLEYQPDS